jgi:hypothetical protein
MAQVLTWNSSRNTTKIVKDDDGNEEEVAVINENIAIYNFSDDTIIEIGNDKTVIKDASGQEQLIISDVNTSNVNHHTSVDEPPSEYYGYKWFYSEADGWVLNEDWVDPRIEIEQN